MIPSDEQQNIIDNIKNGKNVICSAVAGSGKSSTVLFLAEQLREKKLLQITYNSQLRLEVKEKVMNRNIENLEVHTYHSLAVKYYSRNAYTDTELREIVGKKEKAIIKIPLYSVIIIDEAQDMTRLYYLFLHFFLYDMGNKIQLLILGDPMQGLYEFKGSDIRFLTHADKIWLNFRNLENREFIHCFLKMSYRITQQMADFVNNVMLGETRLLACKDGLEVAYMREPTHQSKINILHIILTLLKDTRNSPDDFFILGASIKEQMRKLENILVEKGIPCHVPMFEKEKMDERVIKGKIVFSTFHSVKGRQRKFVFVTGFDNSYFDYFAKELERKKCPNTLYVACTRATECLYLIEKDNHYDDKPLEFLKMSHMEMKKQTYIKFTGNSKLIMYDDTGDKKREPLIATHYITPTELIKFIPEIVLEQIIPMVKILYELIVDNLDEEIEIPVVIETKKGIYEEVSDLNGIAIPFIFSDRIQDKKQQTLINLIENTLKEVKTGELMYLKDKFKKYREETQGMELKIDDYLFLSNLYSSIQEKLYFKIGQIDNDEYTWLSDEILELCIKRIDYVIRGENKELIPNLEVTIINPLMEEETKRINKVLFEYDTFFIGKNFQFKARVDMICPDTIWELKCTKTLTIDNYLQLIIYAWLWSIIYPNEKKEFKIFNIRTGQIYKLINKETQYFTPIVVLLLKSKYEKSSKMTDEEFIINLNY